MNWHACSNFFDVLIQFYLFMFVGSSTIPVEKIEIRSGNPDAQEIWTLSPVPLIKETTLSLWWLYV